MGGFSAHSLKMRGRGDNLMCSVLGTQILRGKITTCSSKRRWREFCWFPSNSGSVNALELSMRNKASQWGLADTLEIQWKYCTAGKMLASGHSLLPFNYCSLLFSWPCLAAIINYPVATLRLSYSVQYGRLTCIDSQRIGEGWFVCPDHYHPMGANVAYRSLWLSCRYISSNGK